MNWKFRFILIFIIIFGIIPGGYSQETDTTETSIWTDFFLIYTINNNFRFLAHTNFKFETAKKGFRQIMIRPALIYTPRDELFVQAGLTFFYTVENGDEYYEIRPWQGINIFFPRINNVYINNFFRLEERFAYSAVDDENFTQLRGRYALMTFIPLNHKDMINNTLYLWPYAELFAVFAQSGVDSYLSRYRFSMGLGYRFTDHIRTELVYMYEKSRNESDVTYNRIDKVIRIVFRYSLFNSRFAKDRKNQNSQGS